MTKINYSKVESSLRQSLDKMFLQNLFDLAAISTQAQEGKKPLNTEEVDLVLKNFRAELKKIKNNNIDLYDTLGITPEQEKRFSSPISNFNREDWLKLTELTEKLMHLNANRGSCQPITLEDEKRVSQERQEQKNRRFNVRKGWLPLD